MRLHRLIFAALPLCCGIALARQATPPGAGAAPSVAAQGGTDAPYSSAAPRAQPTPGNIAAPSLASKRGKVRSRNHLPRSAPGPGAGASPSVEKNPASSNSPH